MKKVVFVLYRTWAYEIYKTFAKEQGETFSIEALIVTSTSDFNYSNEKNVHVIDGSDQASLAHLINEIQPDIIFFYGWSWIIQNSIIKNYTCICLHPSPLPRYRGGSPVQHQIIQGELNSAVTLFKMGSGVDGGDIYKQGSFSLVGSLDEIFTRITSVGVSLTRQLLSDLFYGSLQFYSQSSIGDFPIWKRRKKEESELKLSSIQSMDFLSLYNFVRALAEPYPNAYIVHRGKRILIQEVKYLSDIGNAKLLTKDDDYTLPLFINLKEGYAEISKFSSLPLEG